MIRKILLLLSLGLVAACEPPAGAPAVDYRPGEAGTVDHALCLLGFAAIPVLEVEPGHHLVEARINGQTGYFVLDTGANLTAISAARAGRFGLSAGGSGLTDLGGAAPAGATPVGRIAVDSFEIGPIAVRQGRVVIAELQILASLSRVSGQEVVGIIGQDVLNEHRAIIDVARPMLYLMADDRDPSPVAAGTCRAAEAEDETAAASADLPAMAARAGAW